MYYLANLLIFTVLFYWFNCFIEHMKRTAFSGHHFCIIIFIYSDSYKLIK